MAYAAWLVIAALAHNPQRWAATIGFGSADLLVLAGARRSIVQALWDTAVVALPIEQAPPRVRVAAAAHAAERDQQHDEATALLERHRAGEPGIVVGVEELLADLSRDANSPGAAPAG